MSVIAISGFTRMVPRRPGVPARPAPPVAKPDAVVVEQTDAPVPVIDADAELAEWREKAEGYFQELADDIKLMPAAQQTRAWDGMCGALVLAFAEGNPTIRDAFLAAHKVASTGEGMKEARADQADPVVDYDGDPYDLVATTAPAAPRTGADNHAALEAQRRAAMLKSKRGGR